MTSLSKTVPHPFDSFIGRAEELPAVKTPLAMHRLVTVIGAAGIGKTRLALRAAEESAPSYPEGVCFVGLVQLKDPTLVPQAVASALGVREQPDRSLVDSRTSAVARARELGLL
jgi:predicted ATPase